LRGEMRVEVRRILHLVGATALFVTHDRREALAVADRVSVLMDGRIVQTATPREIYARPATPEAAAFVGEANLLEGRADGRTAECALGVVDLAVSCSGPVTILVRPEQIELGSEGVAVTVLERSFVGDHVDLDVEVSGGTRLSVRVGAAAEPPIDGAPAARVLGSVMAWPATPAPD
jgi:iron(III) transport system ATP-binding protein